MTRNGIALLTDGSCSHLNEVLEQLRTVSISAASAASQLSTREYTVPAAWGERWQDVRRLPARLLADQVGAIHAMSPVAAAVAAGWLSARTRLPLIFSYYGKESKARRHYNAWLFGRCTRVVVPSEYVRASILAAGWSEPARLVVARAGVDSCLFSPAKRSASLRAAWRVSDRRPAIVCAGPVSQPGLDLLTRVRTILAEYRRPHRFVVAGRRDDLEAWQTALPDAMFVDHADLPELSTVFASADICLTTGQADPDPARTLLMAQAAGLPVIVPHEGGHAEALLDGLTGHVCHAGSEQDFAWRTAELLANTSRRRTMAAAAVAYARSRTWATSLEPLIQTYSEILGATAERRKPATSIAVSARA